MDLIKTLTELDGFWKYNGGKYLAELASGLISDTFINTGVLTCRPDKLSKAVMGLMFSAPFVKEESVAGYMKFSVTDDIQPLYVCGPAMGGVTLAYEIARQLGATAIFTEPVHEVKTGDVHYSCPLLYKGPLSIAKTGQVLKRFAIPKNATLLFVEDVITTGKSTAEMIQAVDRLIPVTTCNVTALPYVLCLVNRSGKDTLHEWEQDGRARFPGGQEIISLADVEARTWDTLEDAEKELLKNKEVEGVDILEAVRPKEHWNSLCAGFLMSDDLPHPDTPIVGPG